MKNVYKSFVSDYPIVSIEDPFDQDDWEHYAKMTAESGQHVQIVGDDLLVTNPKVLKGNICWSKVKKKKVGGSLLTYFCSLLLQRVEKAIREKTCNALLLKVELITF